MVTTKMCIEVNTNILKIQISSALISGTYGAILILYIFLCHQFFWETQEIRWRFYGLGGLICIPSLFGFLIANLHNYQKRILNKNHD